MSGSNDTRTHLWDTRPSQIAPAIVGYFGRHGSMSRGQRLAVLAEARGGRFMVAPVDTRRRIVGTVRAVLRRNLALVQGDLFVAA